MSETDSFIDEVTEEVRRDKLFAMFRRYGWIGVLFVVLIVGGASWNEWKKAQFKADSQAFGDSVLAALDVSDPQARVAALESVAAGEMRARDAVATLLAADETLKAGDRAGALARLQTVAENQAAPASLRDLARLKALVLEGKDMDAAARDAALADLAKAGAPYRVLAMEQQAIDLADAGNTDGALALLRQILEEPDATAGLRRRVTQLIVALGGNPEPA